jgi:hypothetical protein
MRTTASVRTLKFIIAEVMVLVLLTITTSAQEINFKLIARDSTTEFAVPAKFALVSMLRGGPAVTQVADETGTISISALPGEYSVEVSALGYKPINSRISVEKRFAGETLLTFMLERETPPAELLPGILNAKKKPDHLLLVGYVSDSVTGAPLHEAKFKLLNAEAQAQTNERGYFELLVKTPVTKDTEYGYCDDVRIEHERYTTIIYSNQLLGHSDSVQFSLTLNRGSGAKIIDATHKLLRGVECPKMPKQ